MTPQERTATAARLYMEMLNTLPTTSSAFHLSGEELAEQERAGRDLGQQMRDVLHPGE